MRTLWREEISPACVQVAVGGLTRVCIRVQRQLAVVLWKLAQASPVTAGEPRRVVLPVWRGQTLYLLERLSRTST